MTQSEALARMDKAAEAYVKLVLAVGQHDADYVDAYHGPESWKEEVITEKKSLPDIKLHANVAIGELQNLAISSFDEIVQLRFHYLLRQLQSLISRVDLLCDVKMTFDEESKALYDAVAPTFTESHFKEILRHLDGLLPGRGRIPERYNKFKEEFVIPRDRLDTVFAAAIEESRTRTKRHISLPEHESFTVEYVTNKSWSGYNWYKGNSHSLIQINIDLPIYIDRAIDLASHEGYPGHHVYNSLLEHYLVRERKWIEFTVYALFSPQSLIAEGTANFGIEVAFPSDERVDFERAVLFPLAEMDVSKVHLYYRIHEIFLKLNYAGNEAARQYLNGTIGRDEAARWLVDYALMSHDRAQQRTRFFDQYRSYVINYNLGQDLVKEHIESNGGTPDNPDRRWAELTKLISSPRLPSGLREYRGTK